MIYIYCIYFKIAGQFYLFYQSPSRPSENCVKLIACYYDPAFMHVNIVDDGVQRNEIHFKNKLTISQPFFLTTLTNRKMTNLNDYFPAL